MKSLLGTSNQTLTFDPTALYRPDPSLLDLDRPFTIQEVEIAIKSLAKNKASGPDGIPNEFLQTYWPELKMDIMSMINEFYHNQLSLREVNRANVVMIHKKESPSLVNDYRPISVINAVPKLFSKLLSNRLRTQMPNLISCNQTAFIQGR